MLVFFEICPDQLEIFSYYSGIFYKTLELLISNHLIIHIWLFYNNIHDSLFKKICEYAFIRSLVIIHNTFIKPVMYFFHLVHLYKYYYHK